MESLLQYLFYGIYATAFAFFMLVIYLNHTNRRIGLLLKKINVLSGKDENADMGRSLTQKIKWKLFRLIVKAKAVYENFNLQKYVYEYLLKGNIITVIGSILFVLGISFFVRFSIFDSLLNFTARMTIALLGSILLIILSHLMFKKHQAFSSVILGASFSIMYFSFITAYYNYRLFSTEVIFFIIIIITIFAVTLSLIYKRYLLVTLSFLAAYTSPFLVGWQLYDSFLLFKYLIILDIGLLVQISFRKNLFLNLTAFTFSGLYFLIWLVKSSGVQDYQNFDVGFLYLMIFYIILIPINSISNILKKKLFKAFELSVIITLNMLFYTAGMYMLNILNPEYRGVFTAVPAIVNLVFLIILLKYVNYNKNLKWLAMGLIVVFMSLIPPVALIGRSISMVWALQLILLLWISQKINVVLMKLGAFLISLAFTVNTLMALVKIYLDLTPLSAIKPILMNSDFISGLATSASLAISIYLMKNEQGKFLFKPMKVKYYKVYAGLSAGILLYASMYVELKYQITTRITSIYSQKIIEILFNFGFVFLPVLASLFLKPKFIKKLSIQLSLLMLAVYLITFYFVTVRARASLIAGNDISQGQFMMTFFIDFILLLMLLIAHINSKKLLPQGKYLYKLTIWLLSIFVFISLSFSLDHYWIIKYSNQGAMTAELLTKVHLLPYTLLWSSLALLLTTIGTIFNIRPLRRIAIFSVISILIKLFFHDMIKMNIQERTLAMIVVGTVLIIITFIYQFNQKKFLH